MTASQRWRDGRDSYRPPDDLRFDPSHHDVVLVETEEVIRPFVEGHHYSGSLPNSGRFRYLLIDNRRPSWAPDGIVGAAVFGTPSGPNVLRAAFPFLAGPALEACELQRLVLLDNVLRNGESWLVAQAMRRGRESLASHGVEAVVSFSDPVPRWWRNTMVKPGHVGCVYQALSAWYTGRSKRRAVWYVRDTGRQLNERDLTKIRAACPCCGSGRSTSGGRGAVERLRAMGARPPSRRECWRVWLASALPDVAVRLTHGGNHRYVWGLRRASTRALRRRHGDVDAGAYPKTADTTTRPPWARSPV